MNKDQLGELDIMIADVEREVEKFPGFGISNYDLLRILYFLKSVFSERPKEN